MTMVSNGQGYVFNLLLLDALLRVCDVDAKTLSNTHLLIVVLTSNCAMIIHTSSMTNGH